MPLLIFLLFQVIGLFAQKNLIFHVGSYESFKVSEDTISLKMEITNQYEEDLGKVETKWANYQPLVITAYKLDTISSENMKDFIVNRTKKLFIKPDFFQLYKEYETTQGTQILILHIDNKHLPFKYIVYSAYVFDNLVFDLLKMQIKDDNALEKYLANLDTFTFEK